MWSFLTGGAAAIVLAAGTYLVLEFGATTSIERYENVSVIVEDEVGQVTEMQ